MRLFAGLPLPPAAVERLSAVRLRLGAPKDGLRWSAPDQWHITLRFFGAVNPEAAHILTSELAQVQSPPLELTMDALGVFRAKGILFAAVATSPALGAVHEQIHQLLAPNVSGPSGTLTDRHAFHPHITLARSRNKVGNGTLGRLASPALPSIGPAIRWLAKEMLLYESELRPSGAVYRTVGRYPLR